MNIYKVLIVVCAPVTLFVAGVAGGALAVLGMARILLAELQD